MNASFVIAYVKRCREELQQLHKRERISMPRLWLDCTWALFRHGCGIRQYVKYFYRYSSFERRDIITCRRYYKILRGMNDSEDIRFLEQKDLFNEKFHKFIQRRWLVSKDMTMEAFADLCSLKEKLIVKPLDGMEGNGVYTIDESELVSSEQMNKQFHALKENNVIIEQFIHQHPRMTFNNQSVNTLRIITVMGKDAEAVTVVKAVLRAGVGESVVDNFHQGGCCYEVDLDTGRICSLGISMQTEQVLFHPGTDICMPGYEIPNWNTVMERVREAHLTLPTCRYISWDVAVTEEGIELIEGNHNGDYDMLEFVGRNKYWPLMKSYI